MSRKALLAVILWIVVLVTLVAVGGVLLLPPA